MGSDKKGIFYPNLPDHSLLLHQSRTSQAPSMEKKNSFMAEKSPGKPFTPQAHKGKPSEPAPHHPHSSTDAALGASTGVLEANLQIRELGQAKTFPLTAPGTGICQGLGRIRAQREMPRAGRWRGHGLGGGGGRALPLQRSARLGRLEPAPEGGNEGLIQLQNTRRVCGGMLSTFRGFGGGPGASQQELSFGSMGDGESDS